MLVVVLLVYLSRVLGSSPEVILPVLVVLVISSMILLRSKLESMDNYCV